MVPVMPFPWHCLCDDDHQPGPRGPVGIRHTPGPAPLPPLARERRGRAPPGRTGLRSLIPSSRPRPVPRHDVGGDGARNAALRRLRGGEGTGQGGRQPGQEGGGRRERLRDERGALAPHPDAAGEPRADGVSRRRPHAKVGETPEMGANPMLGFGRVYARPELARTVDRRVSRLLNEPGHTFAQFYEWLLSRGITLWGAAVDTLENTSRFADGKSTGPMAV